MRFPKDRYRSKDGNFYFLVYACIQAYLKHHLPESDRSISSIHNKCRRLFNDTRLSLSTGSEDQIFYNALRIYGTEIIRAAEADIYDVWQFTMNIHQSVVMTNFSLYFYILGEDYEKLEKWTGNSPGFVEYLLYCIDSCNILSQKKLPNVVFNLAKGISTERFPLTSVIFGFMDENPTIFLLDNTSGMEYHRSTKALWKGARYLFGGAALRYFQGYRNTGQRLLSSNRQNVYNPQDANIAVIPSETVLNKFDIYDEALPKRLKPGIFIDSIKQAVASTPPGAAMCLKLDGRK